MHYKEELRQLVLSLPQEAGIYKFYSKENEIIYVGKAINLKKRVSSYFTKNHEDKKTQRLVSEIRRIEYTVVDTETDALLLENNLIKHHQPHYNIMLKDGRGYPHICITKEHFPRLFSTRKIIPHQGEYFGPYTNQKPMWALLELIRKLYPLRTCTHNLSPKNVQGGKYKVCLEYHLKNCKGGCQGFQSEADYNADIEQIRHILKGKLGFAKAYFKQKMQEAAEKLAFEEAHHYKERLEALEDYQSKSLVVNPLMSDLDVFTIISDEKSSFVNYLQIQNGCIIHTHTESVRKKLNETEEEILMHLILDGREKFKSQSKKILSNISLRIPLPDIEYMIPKIGDSKKLVELSLKNAIAYQKEEIRRQVLQKEKEKENPVLEILKKELLMTTLPKHIECFDNSNLQGTNPVSSMVCFKHGKPSKKDYRKYKVKTVEGIDDFATMYEVVYRRYRRLLDEEQPLPNLVVIDGGKGQLGAACQALENLGIMGKFTIVGLAKRLEEVFFPNDAEALFLNRKSPALRLLQHIRNEAHRFAITFHRQRRSKTSIKSYLEDIEGIGEKTILKLLEFYKSVKKIKAAPAQDLVRLVGTHKYELLRQAFEEDNREEKRE